MVTSAEANAFPAGLPVGTVHYIGNAPMVVPAARLSRLDVVRVFDYRLAGVLPPEAGEHRAAKAPPVPYEP